MGDQASKSIKSLTFWFAFIMIQLRLPLSLTVSYRQLEANRIGFVP